MILRQKKQKLVLHHIVMRRCVNARKKKNTANSRENGFVFE